MLRKGTALEAKYLLKLMLGDMRIGVKESLVEEGIAVAACAAGHATDVAAVRHAVMLEADLGDAAVRAFAGTLAEAKMRLFHPLGFMLASPVESPEEAVARFTAKPAKVPVVKKGRKKKGGAELDEAMQEALENDMEAALPDELKDGIEALSGVSLEGLRVHENSVEPAGLQALVYAEGSKIHTAGGQEEHVAHEAWHVAQEMQGRVRGTEQSAGAGVNDEDALEG